MREVRVPEHGRLPLVAIFKEFALVLLASEDLDRYYPLLAMYRSESLLVPTNNGVLVR